MTPDKLIELLDRNEAALVAARKALEMLPHEITCDSLTWVHSAGYIHLETDAGGACPAYHYEPKGPCNCAKSMQERTKETNDRP